MGSMQTDSAKRMDYVIEITVTSKHGVRKKLVLQETEIAHLKMNIQKPLNILIFGSGAVGSTLGWRLAQNLNTRLSVVCRSNYDIVKRHGLRMNTNLWGTGTFKPHRVVRSTREVSDVAFDYVVCANKIVTSDCASTIKELAYVLSPETALVSAQNGVDVEAPLSRAFPRNTILSAICYISCLQPTPGVVHQVSNIRPHAFHIGAYDMPRLGSSVDASQQLEDFVALDAQFKRIEEVKAERWTKQIFNGAWNPMTAISGLDTHPLIASPYLNIVRQLAQETFNVAVGLGVSLPKDLPEKTIDFARNNPSITPSMLQDARGKRLMEIDSLCGNVIRQAEQIRVPVPTVKMVYHALLEMNRQILASTQLLRLPEQEALNVRPM
ncbi:2-dehydropantoate 2-reductase-like protein [Phaeosphaeria sp. MPI-PUGE-AT-0046c]|nr:2-dehydropantoate 2-reductase-like protein [Phaeosphaeria sp. MPI-PUGE-AT-0046c]